MAIPAGGRSTRTVARPARNSSGAVSSLGGDATRSRLWRRGLAHRPHMACLPLAARRGRVRGCCRLGAGRRARTRSPHLPRPVRLRRRIGALSRIRPRNRCGHRDLLGCVVVVRPAPVRAPRWLTWRGRAGRGTVQRIWELAGSVSAITRVFLTHLHSDHVVGLPDVWLTGRLRMAFGRRSAPLHDRRRPFLEVDVVRVNGAAGAHAEPRPDPGTSVRPAALLHSTAFSPMP